jgi:hypothetical protein
MLRNIKIVRCIEYPQFEGLFIDVDIIDNEKSKKKMNGTKGNKKPKQPRVTVAQLAVIVNNLVIEMRAGFARIDKRIDKIEETLERHEQILNEHTKILKKHEEILMRHEEILIRHEEILKRHELIFERNNLK